jgi:hypothetical protein
MLHDLKIQPYDHDADTATISSTSLQHEQTAATLESVVMDFVTTCTQFHHRQLSNMERRTMREQMATIASLNCTIADLEKEVHRLITERKVKHCDLENVVLHYSSHVNNDMHDTGGSHASSAPRHANAVSRLGRTHASLAIISLVDMPAEVLQKVCAFVCGDDVRELRATLVACSALWRATVARVAFLNPDPETLRCHVVARLEKQMWERCTRLRSPCDNAHRMIVRDTYLEACQALDLPPLPHMLDPVPPRDWPRERVCIILSDAHRDSYLVNMLSGRRRFVYTSSIAQVVVTRCNDDWFQVHRTRPPCVYPNGRKFNAYSINQAIYDGFIYCSPFESNVTYALALLKPHESVSAK